MSHILSACKTMAFQIIVNESERSLFRAVPRSGMTTVHKAHSKFRALDDLRVGALLTIFPFAEAL